MKPSTWMLIAAGAALLTFGGREVVKRVKAGKQIGGPDAYPGPDGIVPGSPAVLAAQAGVDLEVYALARLMRSEAGTLPELARVGVAHAARNRARALKTSLFGLLGGKERKFAAQNVPGRYAATAQPPTAGDLALAARVLSGELPDPTSGATKWDSPRTQRALVARKAKGYKSGPEEVAANRRREGYSVVYLPGIDPDRLRFWRKAPAAGGFFS